MATTEDELTTLRAENEAKRKAIREAERKAAALQKLVENDSTKSALEKEAANLDAELAKAQETVKALEMSSGVSADSLKLPALREGAILAPLPSKTKVSDNTDATKSEK